MPVLDPDDLEFERKARAIEAIARSGVNLKSGCSCCEKKKRKNKRERMS